MAVFDRCIDRRKVLFDNLSALLAVCLLNRGLNFVDSLIFRKHAGDCEIAGLHDGVDSSAHAGFLRDFVGVDYIEFKFLFYNRALDVAIEVVPYVIGVVYGVEEEYRTFRRA